MSRDGSQSNGIKKILLLSTFYFLAILLMSSDPPQSGFSSFKYFKNYTPEDYNYNAQNWGIIQDKLGVIYAANQAGILEFDGVTWHKYKIPNRSVRSLAVDAKGTIFIGGENQMGYLAPDQKGNLSYHSLVNYLKKDERSFSTVWKTHASKKGIFFQTRHFIFRWHLGKMRSWKSVGRFFFSFLCRDTLYVRNSHFGLMKIKDDSLIPAPGGDIFKTRKIYMMVPYDTKRIVIGTLNAGFYLYDGSTMQPFPTAVDDYLKERQLYHGICMSSGDFALGTTHGGLVIIDNRGNLKHIFSTATGLQDEDVKYIYEDYQKNIWLALGRGITKIEYNLPFSVYDRLSGLNGLVLSISKYRRHLYAGTTRGLYVLEGEGTFKSIPNFKNNCFSLLPIDNSLLAATTDGLYQINGNSVRLILDNRSYALFRSKKVPGRIWVGVDVGLFSLHAVKSKGEIHWRKELRIPGLESKITSITEDKNGDVWLGTPQQIVFRIQLSTGRSPREAEIKKYDRSNGLPNEEIRVIRAAGHIMFAAPRKGVFCFDENSNYFIPDLTLGKEFAGESLGVFRIVEDTDKNIWFHSKLKNFRAYPGPTGTYVVEAHPFRWIHRHEIYAIYPDPEEKIVWFGGSNGIIRFDTKMKTNYNQDAQALIRRIIINNEYRFANLPPPSTSPGSETEIHVFKPPIRDISFSYAAPFFQAEERTLYQTYLEGYDNKWSQWTQETHKEYFQLQPGKYCFWVRANTVYGKVGGKANFRFTILPPWYLSWWAITAYVIMSGVLVFLLIKWRVRKLEQEKKKLQEKIRQSTRELEEKNRILETQTHRLQEKSEELKEMNRIKSRFFANISHEFRTPLTLIMAPLEKKLEECLDKTEQEQYETMLMSAQRLLNLINQLLDLSKIDGGKQKLQVCQQNIIDFTRSIISSFQVLARENDLNMEFVAEEEDILLYFDPPKMEEILYNLLINSVKFTPPGGSITVSIKKSSPLDEGSLVDGVEISIKDTGTGIPKDQLPHIFDRFYQAETSGFHRGTMEGTGIGLALSRELVRLHHGNIDVHSTEGQGTEFIIVLPLGKEHLEEAELLSPAAAMPSLQKSPKIAALYGKKSRETAGQEIKENLKAEIKEKDVVLVVEDNAELRRYIRVELEPEYQVVEAADGAEGIDTSKDIIPDLIISDIMMPEKDGIQLCRDLKRDLNTCHIPIILLTARAGEEDMIKGLQTGADDYITKPFNMKILTVRVKNLIQLRHQLQLTIQRHLSLLPDKIPIQTLDEKFLKDLHDMVQANITDPDFNIDSLVKKMKMSRTSLFRKVKALTGLTPNDYIISFRLERAAQMLKAKYGTVTDVAYDVGFSNSSYFAKLFKEKFHYSPSTYMSNES
jgi:signal transduction histidine kinase/DNA-binding response OmpR family regulator/ligand-binding sensor domain-containing protein